MLHDPGEIAGIHWKRNDSLNGSDTVCLMQEDSRKESDKKKVCQSSFHLARRKILCKRYSTKSRMALESRADSGLNPLITESHGGQNGMRAGTA